MKDEAQSSILHKRGRIVQNLCAQTYYDNYADERRPEKLTRDEQ